MTEQGGFLAPEKVKGTAEIHSGVLNRISSLFAGEPSWLWVTPAVLLLPFLSKAFHIDDTLFLLGARIVARTPLNPFSFTFDHDGKTWTLFSLPNPLLWHYLLAGWRMVVGESEWAFHLLTFAFAILALRSLGLLARFLGLSPFLACVFFAGSSAFIATGSTIMPDLPCAACALTSLACMVRGFALSRWIDLALAGLFATASFLMRYNAAFLFLLLLIYPITLRRLKWASLIPFAVGMGGVAAAEVWQTILNGSPHFLNTLHAWAQPPSAARLAQFGFLELVHLGAQMPLLGGLLLVAGLWRWSSLVATLGSLILSFAAAQTAPRSDRPFLTLLAWPALLVLVNAIRQVVQNGVRLGELKGDLRGGLRFLLAIWVVVTTFAGIQYVHVAAKYMLLPLPAAILLTLYDLKVNQVSNHFRRAASLAALATALLGFLVGVSDYRWANTYRDFFASRFPRNVTANAIDYYSGDWGFRYYAEQRGLRPWKGQRLRPADRLIFSQTVPSFLNGLARAEYVGREELSYSGPFALMSPADHAGFYSNGWGSYPYVPRAKVADVLWFVSGLP